MPDRCTIDNLLDRLNIPTAGRNIVKEAVKSAPVRAVASHGSNVITVYQSWKMLCEIRTESRNFEFPAGVEHEHNHNVLAYYPQSCRIKFEFIDDQGEIHQIDHIPDFLVITEKELTLEEWKSEAKLEGLARKQPWRYKQDSEGNWYSPCIENWLGERGIRYRIRSEASISRHRLENTMFIEDYLHPSAEACPVDVAARIKETLAQEAVLYLAELYEKAECRPDDVFKLIADGLLIADFDGASLAEPNRFRVFRDHAVRDFENARHAKPAREPVSGVFDLQVGQRLKYNHVPYTVSLVGQHQVVLTDEKGSPIEVMIGTLSALAGNLVQETKNEADIQPSAESLSDFTEDELRTAITRQCGISTKMLPGRTLRRLLKKVTLARAAGTDELVALIPRTRDRGNRSSRLTLEQNNLIDQVIREEHLSSRSPNKRSCYRKLLDLAAQKGIKAPSYPTLINRIKALPQSVSDRARQGKRVAYQNADFITVLYAETPIHGSRPFQYVHMDHTQLDIELVCSRTGKNLGRPWLSLAIDAFTRRILGFYLSFDPPSYRSNMMLLRDIVRRHHRLPQMIVVDNGADFRCENFELFAKLMGIHLRYRPAGQPRFGAVLERLFGSLHSEYIHNLAGNTKATKVIRQTTGKFLPSRLAEWHLEALFYGIQYWAMEYYDQHDHPALDLTPREAFARGMAQSGERNHRIVTLSKDFMILTCPFVDRRGSRKVDRQRGIKVNDRYYYWCPEFKDPKIAGQRVPVRYDPWDASTVYVQINKRWVPAACKTLASLGTMTETERAALSQEYIKRHPCSSSTELTSQRLSEFLRTFTPSGAVALELERQAENRHLYQVLGLAAITSTAPQWLFEHPEAQGIDIRHTAQSDPVLRKKSAPILRPPSPIGDLPDFDIF